MGEKIQIQVADIILVAHAAHEAVIFELQPSYLPFQVAAENGSILLHFFSGDPPPMPEWQLFFDSTGLWRLYRHRQQFYLTLSSPLFGPLPYRVAILDPSFRTGEVYCRRLNSPGREEIGAQIRLNPFEFPLDEVILVHYLVKGRGLNVHAGGVVHDGQGLLFVGPSQAGKSTLTRLWQPTGAKLLSDDRIIIRRKKNGAFQMYGTPWHGDANIGSPESAPLKKIFFLNKASRDSVRPVGRMEAATRLLVCCFPPFHDQDGMAFVLDFISQIVAEVPCYELNFLPEPSVIDFIQGVA